MATVEVRPYRPLRTPARKLLRSCLLLPFYVHSEKIFGATNLKKQQCTFHNWLYVLVVVRGSAANDMDSEEVSEFIASFQLTAKSDSSVGLFPSLNHGGRVYGHRQGKQ